jgi:hypothetical protein
MRVLGLIMAVYVAAVFALPGSCQGYVRLYGGDQGAIAPSPASNSNPVPVTVTGGAGASVAVTSTVNPTGVAQANITNTTAAIPASSTAVTLVAASTNITISTSPGAAILYVDYANGTATSGDFAIYPGQSQTFTGVPAITTFKVIGASASGNYSVLAH